ncbi:MAG: LPXTG cell wall anchor domain-containing protein [Lachnospiraceae bacterium]|nr:LPXTG cell wall anchor domain-containing protein [Lachnospiraceae bacterium]
MKRSYLNKAGSMILALIISFPLLLGLAGKAKAEEYDTDRYKMITVHAGEEGYFSNDPTIHEIETLQFKGDVFDFGEKPKSDSLVFQGWAITPDATEPDVFPGLSKVNDLGADVYAIWSNEITVSYRAIDGIVIVDGQPYDSYEKTCPVGGPFTAFQAEPMDSRVFFAGWNTAQSGDGTTYVAGQTLGSENLTVYSQWELDETKIEQFQIDTVYTINGESPGVYYSFTPSESDVYAIRAVMKDREGSASAMIQMITKNLVPVSRGQNDADGTAILTVSMEAGKTYYFQVRESYGFEAEITVCLTKANYKTVTFHANHGDEAYFDEDPNLKEKQFRFEVGTNLKYFNSTGLIVADPQLGHIGWSTNPDDESTPEGYNPYEVKDDMDLYAIYNEFSLVTLDANGGTFPTYDNETVIYQNVRDDGNLFITTHVPKSADPTKKFLGWATTKDAETSDIPENAIPAIQLKGMTLYAVYTDKVLVTYDANGGHFMMTTGPEIYMFVVAKGSQISGITAYKDNLVPYSYMDQDGVEALYSKDITYLDYTVEKDTYFTVQWGREITLHANGGFFPKLSGARSITVVQKIGGVFNTDVFEEITGGVFSYNYLEYLAGWGTRPDLDDPDVIAGVTPVDELPDTVNAIYKDDIYYFIEGENGTWEKGSKDTYRVVVKRMYDDENTYPSFVYADPSGILIDGKQLILDTFHYQEYFVESGSLILSLYPAYLEGLSVGEHTVAIRFRDSDPVTTTFTITEAAAPSEDTPADTSPKTGDANNAVLWICLAAGAFVIIIGVILLLKKKT